MVPLRENNKVKSIPLKLSIGALVFGATIWISSSLLDLTSVFAAFLKLRPETAIIIFLLGAISWLLRGLRTWVLFERFSLAEAFGISFLHNTANNLAPMRLGELALPALARWIGRVDFSVALTNLIWIRLLDFISLIGISLCVVMASSLGVIVFALLATFIFLTPLLLSIVVPKMQYLNLPSILEQSRTQLIYETQNGRRLQRIWRLTILSWITKLMGMMMMLSTLSGIPITKTITMILGAELSSILPIHGLAGAGTYEAGGVIGSTFIGILPATGLALTLQLHIYVLSLTAVFGILGFLLLLKRTLNG